jgi:hypothetical protein
MTAALDAHSFYGIPEIARIVFGHRARWFYENRARLEAEGFPRPISCVGRPRWSGADLIAWAARPRAHDFAPNVIDATVLLRDRSRAQMRPKPARMQNGHS